MLEPRQVGRTAKMFHAFFMSLRQYPGSHKEFADMDVKSKNVTVATSDSGLTPSTIPGGCDNAQNGVSVRNMPAPKEGYEWYVFRANYGREDKAYKLLEDLGADIYIPRHTVYTRTSGGVKPLIKKLMPYFVFAYLSKYEAQLYAKGPANSDAEFDGRSQSAKTAVFELNSLISFYYNHFAKGRDGLNPPLVVPYGQMEKFYIATRLEKDVIPVEPGTFKVGDEVEVVEGDFKGLTGRIMLVETKKHRLKIRMTQGGTMLPQLTNPDGSKRRLLFQLPCLGSFGSALIPMEYFRKIT